MSNIKKLENTSYQEISPYKLLSLSDTIIFDMDGTLYHLDGKNNGFANSSLQKCILSNAKQLIAQREGLNPYEAQAILDQIISSNQHLSHGLRDRYNLSRKEVFDNTWNVEPQNILIDYENSKDIIDKIKTQNKKLILLTTAPQVWQQRVFSRLGITGMFSEIYTGEDFENNKDEMLPIIQSKHSQETILSIGDQLESDILPAKKLGMLTYHVSHPRDLLLLFKND